MEGPWEKSLCTSLFLEKLHMVLVVCCRAWLFVLLKRFFIICDSNCLCWQVFLVFLVMDMESTFFPLSLLPPFIHWEAVIMLPLCLVFRASSPTVFHLPSQVVGLRPLIVLLPFLWTLSNGPWLSKSVIPAGEHNAPGEASLALSEMLVALRVLQTLLLLKYRSMAFTFFSAAYYCHCTLSLWSTAPSPLISFLLSCFPANCSLFTVCVS